MGKGNKKKQYGLKSEFGATLMENLGKQISERRKKLCLSQEDLAEISGVSPRTRKSEPLNQCVEQDGKTDRFRGYT